MGGETGASEQKGVMQWTGTLLRPVFDFGQGLRCGFVHQTLPLLLNYGGLICFLALLPRSFVLVCCLREANVLFFAGGLVGVDKHLCQRVSIITSMTLPLNYIFVLLLANVDVIPKQKQLSTV